MCHFIKMRFLGIYVILYCVAFVATLHWFKSSSSVTYDVSDILYSANMRSPIECASECNKDNKCITFLYNKSIKNCILVSGTSLEGPTTITSDVPNYSKTPPKVCPAGYSELPTTKVCVKLFNDYLSWNDSLAACQSDGASLPVLNTTDLYKEFLEYMDKKATNRVVLNGYLINNIPYWSTGETVNSSLLCQGIPDSIDLPGVCLYMANSTEAWCNPVISNRIDDAECFNQALRICIKHL